MIELFEQNIRTNDRQSSKGNQLKWENKGIWYKADYTGYEGLAEYMISHLLKKSTLAENEFTCYDLEKIKYGTVIYNGVKSKNFLSEDWQIITLERLFKSFFGESLYKALYRILDKNIPQSTDTIIERLVDYKLCKQIGDDWVITNLGAIFTDAPFSMPEGGKQLACKL